MDEQVIAAMARWPDVPAVYGWLSLSESGQWRLHPAGNALQHTEAPGEAITSPQILAFINRNYAADPDGQWYFQNGPQRVYVRLDAAPFIAHTSTAASGHLMLRTHTGLEINQIQAMHLDDTGRLYVVTEHGPALIAGRDLPGLLDALQASPETHAAGQIPDTHETLAHSLETGADALLRSQAIQGFPSAAIPLHRSSLEHLETTLKFRRFPQAQEPPANATTLSGQRPSH